MQQVLQRAAKALPGEAGRSAAAAVTRQGQVVGAASASALAQEQAAVEVLAKHLDQDQGLVSSNGCILPSKHDTVPAPADMKLAYSSSKYVQQQSEHLQAVASTIVPYITLCA
jgi:hypothetical protein